MKRWFLLSFIIATVVLNMFLNQCFMVDSVGVVFDRSISVCCGTSLRGGGHKWTLLSGRGFGLLLVFCGLPILVILVQCTNPGTLLRRVDFGGGSLVLICTKGLMLVMSSAWAQHHRAESGSSALWCNDSNVGLVLSWWCAGGSECVAVNEPQNH